ncbi:nitrogenase cofactor biosynthesis protein NifB [Oceanospirillum sediminis]|uniref:nitrogenase cofactor biosynthesis protein NifB n=1 Tax=Oceanospirillum sediminis TaxID=2760088 RepID=UPI001C7274FD
MKLPVLIDKTVSNPIEQQASGGCSSGSCGSSQQAVNQLPADIQARVADHPCFSEQAHHFFARMHVAVAPACNIQCNYCNRKYDCSNESRPGVVSEVLSPDQAIQKVKAVAASIPQMTVLGIAGPGDPLANPERTFETFRRLSRETPDIKLCVSTNGLNLPDCVEELSQHNIEHVTITINCLDPEIGARIYPWIFWNHKRVRGVEAARILIEQQQKGLEMLVARGILVKVNSVMIPGINDQHLLEVSRVVKEKGAFLHNVMPIIAEPEHGTYFGLTGQREPTHQELQSLQDACAGDMNMMRHCRQCRADAVGLLGEDRGEEFTLEKIAAMDIDYDAAMEKRQQIQAQLLEQLHRQQAGGEVSLPDATLCSSEAQSRPVLMAVASKGGGLVNQHFGHATEFLIYEASPQGVRFVGHRSVDKPYCENSSSCGDGDSVLQTILSKLKDCEMLLCSKVGYEPWSALEDAGIQPDGSHALEPIEDAIQAVYQEMADKDLLSSESETQQQSA